MVDIGIEVHVLPPAQDDLRRRRWIWQAISDLFLDEEPDDHTFRHIARVAAECEYTEYEIEAIYNKEVGPAVGFNLLDPAGTWGYFDTLWLEDRILRRSMIGYWFDRLLAALPCLLTRRHWNQVKRILVEEHMRVASAKRTSGWKPCCVAEAPIYRWAGGDTDDGTSKSETEKQLKG